MTLCGSSKFPFFFLTTQPQQKRAQILPEMRRLLLFFRVSLVLIGCLWCIRVSLAAVKSLPANDRVAVVFEDEAGE